MKIKFHIIVLTLVWALPSHAFVRLTQSPGISDQPHAAVDSSGNIHVMWIDDRHSSTGTFELYYKMMGASGQTLISDTLVSDDDQIDSYRPHFLVDASKRVHLIWMDKRTGGDSIFFARLDPTLDDLNGDAAIAGVVKDVDDVQISTGDDFQHYPHVAMDPSGNLHAVWEDDLTQDLHYIKFASSGSILVAQKALNPGGWAYTSHPEIKNGPDGNIHVFWSDWMLHPFEVSELYYTMLDPESGSVLMAPTNVTVDDTRHSHRPSLNFDADGKLNIVWQDKRTGTGVSGSNVDIFYMRIDPGADLDSLKIQEDKLLSANDGIQSFLPNAAISSDGLLHVTYYQPDKAHLRYLVADISGNVLGDVSLTGSAYNAVDWTNAPVTAGSGEMLIFWSDDSYGNPEIVKQSTLDLDVDGDGYTPFDGDCDDYDSALNPDDSDLDFITSCEGDTNTGLQVSVRPVDGSTSTYPVKILFAEISSDGLTSLTTSSTGPAPPAGWRSGDPVRYFDIETSAGYSGTVRICVEYADSQFSVENSTGLFHWNGTDWTDVTEHHDTLRNIICGEVSSLSTFALFEPGSNGEGGGGGGGCFVATAVYGSDETKMVEILRDFRDEYLLSNAPGRWFVAQYYRLSPPMADWIRDRDVVRAVVRIFLLPLVALALVLVRAGIAPFLVVLLMAILLGVMTAHRRRAAKARN